MSGASAALASKPKGLLAHGGLPDHVQAVNVMSKLRGKLPSDLKQFAAVGSLRKTEILAGYVPFLLLRHSEGVRPKVRLNCTARCCGEA